MFHQRGLDPANNDSFSGLRRRVMCHVAYVSGCCISGCLLILSRLVNVPCTRFGLLVTICQKDFCKPISSTRSLMGYDTGWKEKNVTYQTRRGRRVSVRRAQVTRQSSRSSSRSACCHSYEDDVVCLFRSRLSHISDLSMSGHEVNRKG